jgi:hypothetical protein
MPKSCPLGHTCDACLWYQTRIVTDVAAGRDIERSDCALNWLVDMSITQIHKAHSVGGAIESFRNEMVKDNARFRQLVNHEQPRLSGRNGKSLSQ